MSALSLKLSIGRADATMHPLRLLRTGGLMTVPSGRLNKQKQLRAWVQGVEGCIGPSTQTRPCKHYGTYGVGHVHQLGRFTQLASEEDFLRALVGGQGPPGSPQTA